MRPFIRRSRGLGVTVLMAAGVLAAMAGSAAPQQTAAPAKAKPANPKQAGQPKAPVKLPDSVELLGDV